MARNPDELPLHVSAVLYKDEVIQTRGWARVQRSATARATFWQIHLVLVIYDGIRNRSRMQKLRARSSASGIPLERNMALCLTSERVLIFKSTPFPRRFGTYLGDLSRSRIVSAQFPFSPSGPWRTVEIQTTDNIRFRIKISAAAAEIIVNQLHGSR